jgi:hypothetical protein
MKVSAGFYVSLSLSRTGVYNVSNSCRIRDAVGNKLFPPVQGCRSEIGAWLLRCIVRLPLLALNYFVVGTLLFGIYGIGENEHAMFPPSFPFPGPTGWPDNSLTNLNFPCVAPSSHCTYDSKEKFKIAHVGNPEGHAASSIERHGRVIVKMPPPALKSRAFYGQFNPTNQPTNRSRNLISAAFCRLNLCVCLVATEVRIAHADTKYIYGV